MVWVGKDLKDHPVPTPLPWQGHLPLDQVAQSPVQPRWSILRNTWERSISSSASLYGFQL